MLAGFAVASFRTSRLDAFFSLAVVILLAPELAAAWTSFVRRPVRRSVPISRGVFAITIVTMVAMLVPAATILEPAAACLSIGGLWVPEPDAGRFIAQNHLTGRMLTWFDWGEYAIWHFGPALKVSMDGRRETVYTDAMIQAHRKFYAADDTALPFLRQLDPDFLWLPVRLPIASKLEGSGWVPVFRGPISTVFARVGAGPFRAVLGPAPTPRCFPGP